MFRPAIATLLLLGVCAPGGELLAKKTAIPCETTWTSKGLPIVQASLESAPVGSASGSGGAEFVFVEFTFTDGLPPGAEIEVWPQVEGEVPPWDLPPEQMPFDRNFWVMDERTGTLVRFDVTQIARAWESGQLPNLGLALRLLDMEEMASSQSKPILNPKEPTLIYHDIRPEKKASGITPGRSGPDRPGKSPDREEGKGGSR